MTPGASNYLVYFIFREVDYGILEGLGNGHHWVFVLFGASLIVLNMWISWELWTPGGIPLLFASVMA